MQFIDRRSLAAACGAILALAAGASIAAPSPHSSKPAKASSHALVLAFEGTPTEFDAALKRNLAIRAKELGVDPSLYADELAQIHDIVATCMNVTTADWATAQTAFNSEMRYVSQHGGPNPVIRRIERLKSCDGSKGQISYFGEAISDPSRPRKLGVGRSMSTFSGSEEVPTPYFHITVSFFGLPEDKDKFQITATNEIPSHYEVIDAKIPRTNDTSASQPLNTPTSCIKSLGSTRDFGLEYLIFQNTCDTPYRVNAATRSGKVVTAVISKGPAVKLMAVVSMTGGFNGRYEVVEP